MLINIYDFEATLRSEAAAASASASSEVNDLIRFDIYYMHRTLEFSYLENTLAGRNKYWVTRSDSFGDDPVSRSFKRSQLMNMDLENDSVFADVAAAAVPDIWAEETANRLTWVVRHVKENYDRTAASRRNLVVEVEVLIITSMVMANESSDPVTLNEIFRWLQEDAISLEDAVATYEPATLSSVQALEVVQAAAMLDPDDCCAICLDKYSTGSDSDGGAPPSSSSETVVMTPCSHKYHYRCIL
ncbi:hypothetical protein SAY87_006229 [Trapa incisa]|uniref:RING-type domain-containing protein n=1 Tax=Trapa incisa TaxID=236973 RepID=A0AAN7K766_9MYRT|nr:hypothetical protein SAY87_006229 [Trapa incisa]